MSEDSTGPENPELLAAIISNPDEDTPRLMYADWLQENGNDARAEFIRLHIEWDRRPNYAPPNEDLKRRLIAAWEKVEPRDGWVKRHYETGHFAFERGFLATAEFEFEGRDYVKRAENVFHASPVRVLYTTPSTYDYQTELDLGPLDLTHFLSVARSLPPVTGFGTELQHNDGLSEHWEEFLKLPQMSALQVLDINYSRGLESCPLVARLTNLTDLLVLDLTVCCRMEDYNIAQLAEAAHLQSLVALRLGADDEYRGAITEAGIGALVRSPHLTNLRQLTLNNHEDLNDIAVHRLLEWDRVGQLEVLELSCRDITDSGVVAMAQSRKLRNLRRLVLDGRQLSQDTLAAVLDSPNLRGLTELYLSPPPVSLTAEVMHRFQERFPNYANMKFDPPAVCVEDRIRARYRLMTHPSGDGTYRGRDLASERGYPDPPDRPEYAIL